jgi:squalene cyclase
LIETFKRLREFVGKYELDRTHPAIEAAAEYIFTYQSEEGDFRGFYVDQYAPHYTGLIVELLTKAGYGRDARVGEAINWLVKVRQSDGGWAYPGLTEKLSWEEEVYISSHHSETIQFDPSRPFSHNITGMAIRALACHPDYAHTEEAITAGELLASRFFQPDLYNSYKAADYWFRFQYPFWWNNLAMALDSLSRIGFSANHPQIKKGLTWLMDHQSEDSLWENSYRKGAKKIGTEKAWEDRLWVTLAICRVFHRLWNR